MYSVETRRSWLPSAHLRSAETNASAVTASDTLIVHSIPANSGYTCYSTTCSDRLVRWYDPVTGRWLSNDPIGISGGLNQYVFCGNNPVNFRDPMGLLDMWDMGGGGGGMGGGTMVMPLQNLPHDPVYVGPYVVHDVVGGWLGLWFNRGGEPAVLSDALTRDMMRLRAGRYPPDGTLARDGFDWLNPDEFQLAGTLGEVTMQNDGCTTRSVNNVYDFPWTNVDPLSGEVGWFNRLGNIFFIKLMRGTPYPLNVSYPSQ